MGYNSIAFWEISQSKVWIKVFAKDPQIFFHLEDTLGLDEAPDLCSELLTDFKDQIRV